MSKTSVHCSWKICATCTHCTGRIVSDPFCAFVEYDNEERSRCAGGAYNMSEKYGNETCSTWTRRFGR